MPSSASGGDASSSDARTSAAGGPNSTRARARQSFHCRHGKAYLFNMVVNVHEGQKEDRLMTTGLHTVADIHCKACMSIVGWKYVRGAALTLPGPAGRTASTAVLTD